MPPPNPWYREFRSDIYDPHLFHTIFMQTHPVYSDYVCRRLDVRLTQEGDDSYWRIIIEYEKLGALGIMTIDSVTGKIQEFPYNTPTGDFLPRYWRQIV